MSEEISVSCRVWRLWHLNISKGLKEELKKDEHKYDSYLWTSAIILTVFGNLFLGAIWHFERFGGDSRKRSLQNRLASQIIIACLFLMNSGIFSTLNQLYRFASYEVLLLHMKVHRALHFIVVDLIFLHTLVVYLQVVIWKRLREWNEELIIRVTWITIYFGNLTLSILCPLEEKFNLYVYMIGQTESNLMKQSHIAEEPHMISK